MRCFCYCILFLAIFAGASVLAHEETISLPYATPGQRYLKQLNPKVEGNFTLPLTYSFRKGSRPPSWFKINPYSGVVDVIVPGARTSATEVSDEDLPYEFVLDVRDADGVLVRSMRLLLTVTSRPEPVKLPLAQNALGVASGRDAQTTAPPVPVPSTAQTFTDPPAPSTTAVVAQLAPPPVITATNTVKATTHQSQQLVKAAAPAKPASTPPDPPDPPAQSDANKTPQNQNADTAAADKPRFTTKPTLSSSTITVAGPAGATITLRVGGTGPDACSVDKGAPVLVYGGQNPATVQSGTVNTVTFALAETLTEGQYVCATIGDTNPLTASDAQQLSEPLDFGRVRAYFATGMIVANNNTSNGSSGSNSAALFLSFNIDKTWALPGCYLLQPGRHATGCAPMPQPDEPDYVTALRENVSDARNKYLKYLVQMHNPPSTGEQEELARKKQALHHAEAVLNSQIRTKQKSRWLPGINTYFDVRLTQIPVSATPPTQSASGSATPVTTNTGTLTTAFLTSQKTGRLGVGIYAPFLVSRWTYAGQPNALFLAPISKVGFNALTGPTQQTFIVSGAASGTGTAQTITQNFNQLYYFFDFGARIGHYTLTGSSDKAPELNSYLDITFGPYSNLPSYVCKAQMKPTPPAVPPLPLLVGSACNSVYSLPNNSVWGDSQTRLWRLDLEGILKVPHTPIIVGFNANIGQKVFAPGHLDYGVQPNDDLRFLFGFRSDIATILQKLGVGNPTQ